MPVKVLVADVNSITRAGLHAVIKQAAGLSPVGEADSAAAVLQKSAELHPQVVVMGEELLEGDGHGLLEELGKRKSQTYVLVLGAEESHAAIERLLSAGAAGFLPRSIAVDELVRGIHRAADGDPALSSKMLGQILRRRNRTGGGDPPADPTGLLSERELEVLRMTGLGLEAKEVAQQLKLSPRTVDVHRANIRRKLGIQGVHHLMRYAMRWLDNQQGETTGEAFAGLEQPLLLVDDDEVDILSVRRSFRELGLEVAMQVARSGEEALAYLRKSSNPRPSLVLLDIKMPGMDGREFLGELRHDPRLRSVPVVVLTSSRQEEDKARMYSLGVTGYLVKPTSSGELTQMLRNLVRFWSMSEKPPRAA